MDICQVVDCSKSVSKAGYTFCVGHWKAERAGKLSKCTACGRWHDTGGPVCPSCAKSPGGDDESGETAAGQQLTSTALGKHFGFSSIKMNLVLAELGWIERYVKGWAPTDRGNTMGANVREMRNGTPYVVWPETILKNVALLASVTEQSTGNERTAPTRARPTTSAEKPRDPSADFRDKFPPVYRTQDGHVVRSRAEVLIDNWLYMQGIVHAYERRLPIEEECYCDFYLPKGKGVYIEFWGRENDPKYRERQAIKRGIYEKHKLRLIELGDAEIERLDDMLPRMLLRFGIESV